MSDPIKLFTVIALISIPTVMFGGYSLLRLNAAKRLDGFRRAYFKAGHAHAGVLLVMSLATLDILARSGLNSPMRWTICLLLLIGVLAQSGGMFVHMAIGQAGRWSAGNSLTTVGGALLAAALLLTAYGQIIA